MDPTPEVDSRLYRSSASEAAQQAAFTSGTVPVAVYGLGKMGLPLASVYADVCQNVVGADIDSAVVETINDGGCHVKREPGLPELVDELVQEGALRATTDPAGAASEAAVHVVIVPTPITDENEPDLSILESVLDDIGQGLSAGDLVVIECTVPPRTTTDLARPILEETSGLEFGEFGLAFCPERTASGRAIEDIRGAYPKVVGGVDAESTRVAKLIYHEINSEGVIPVSDARTAEAVKVFEGLYRDVNIGLANELATMTDEIGIDVREAIDVANTQPFCHIHDPGPGVGGHCIPFYPYFVIEPFDTPTPLLETARQVNDGMPRYTVEKLREEFTAEGTTISDSSVLLLGLTYRPGVEEIRASPALAIAEELTEAGADVYGVDPMLDDFGAFSLSPLTLEEVYEQSFDAVVTVTPHEDFDDIKWSEVNRTDGQLVVIDGRDTFDLAETDHRVYTLGGSNV
jgi:UDP-N-acetyl-D-mannosaminuronic acid dehydrogenase